MFVYEKKLQFPVKITNPNPKLAAFIISQYGGPYINRLLSIKTTKNNCTCIATPNPQAPADFKL